MTKTFRILALMVVVLCAFAIRAEAKPKKTVVYMFGLSVDFADSLLIATDIQRMDPVFIESKTGFLYDRSIYSQQLQIYVEQEMGRPMTTCTVFFSKNARKLEKMLVKVYNKAKKKEGLRIEPMMRGQFRFVPEEWTEHEKI